MAKKSNAGANAVNAVEDLLSSLKAGLNRQKQILTGSDEAEKMKTELLNTHTELLKKIAETQSVVNNFHERMQMKEEAWNETTSKLEAELKERGKGLKEEAKKWKTLLQEKENQYKRQLQELKSEIKLVKIDFTASKRNLTREYNKAEEVFREEIRALEEKLSEAKKSLWNRLFPVEEESD
ncbi:MAG TPA: hypothetical protein VJC03_00710 [bacterium]|nr:hypothetical protein [bacterium]